MLITIANQKGGTGKSFIAFSLTVELSKIYKVVAVDLDTQKSLFYLNKTRNHYQTASPLNIKTISNEREFLDFLSKYDTNDNIIIADTAGFYNSLTKIAIEMSDFIITPTSLDYVDIMGFKYFEKILEDLSVESKYMLRSNIVINAIHPNKKNISGFINFVKQSKHLKLMKTVLHRRADFEQSLQKGKTVIETNHKLQASIELKNFVDEVKKEIKNVKK